LSSVILHSLDWYQTRRRLEAERRAAEQKIRRQAALIEKAQDAILLLSLDRQIVYANPSATRLYGWGSDAIQDSAVPAQLFAPCAGAVDAAHRAISETGEWQGELEQATRAGGKLTVESRWTLIRNEAGQPESILIVNTDVTEKKRIEAQFLRAQRLEAVSSIAGGMAHDLNNALAPVLIGIQRLRRDVVDSEPQRLLALMEKSTQRGAEMVRQVLAFSRGQGDQRELLNPGRLLQEIERIVLQTFPKSIRTATLVPRDLWPVLGNATQLYQVLLNLCVNARDAMPGGGELTLAADNVDLTPEEAAEIREARPGSFVMLLVADTGAGIAPDLLPRLGEPFLTTKPAGIGTGLGLSTSAHLVRSHGGFLNIKSEVGAGTTVEVFLPRATMRSNPESHHPANGVPAARGQGELILLVEDETAVRDMLRSTLEEHGYNVASASTGVEALTILTQRNGDVRLALVDFGMPAMDGLSTIAAARRQRPGIRAVLMSGDLVPHKASSAEGPTGHLTKPFSVDDLLQTVAEQLRA
jgi:PAS domain S-box-containing protein